MEVEIKNIQKPQFREKDIASSANDYSFSCTDENEEEKSIKMRKVGDLWGTGLFKNNACDFCDDVTTELADISLGDAWLAPFDNDGKGTNVIVTRSALAESLIKKGIENRDLDIDFLPLDQFLASQQGSFNHRHIGLPARIKIAKKNKQLVPPKRYEHESLTFDFKMVQKQRMKVRAESLEIWKSKRNAELFDNTMKGSLKSLSFYTKIYHKRRRFDYLKNKIAAIIKKRVFFNKETK